MFYFQFVKFEKLINRGIIALFNIDSIVSPRKRQRRNQKTIHNHNPHKLKSCFVKIKKLSSNEISALLKNACDSISKNQNSSVLSSKETIINSKKTSALAFTSSVIWNSLTTKHFNLTPGVIVFAKLKSYRPWPARINSIYKVGNEIKCYVSFYGTSEIGSVLKNHCVDFNDCVDYLFHTVRELKAKYKWKADYEKISKIDDYIERAKAISGLTQVQKFFVAIRDVERLKKVPYNLSLTNHLNE